MTTYLSNYKGGTRYKEDDYDPMDDFINELANEDPAIVPQEYQPHYAERNSKTKGLQKKMGREMRRRLTSMKYILEKKKKEEKEAKRLGIDSKERPKDKDGFLWTKT